MKFFYSYGMILVVVACYWSSSDAIDSDKKDRNHGRRSPIDPSLTRKSFQFNQNLRGFSSFQTKPETVSIGVNPACYEIGLPFTFDNEDPTSPGTIDFVQMSSDGTSLALGYNTFDEVTHPRGVTGFASGFDVKTFTWVPRLDKWLPYGAPDEKNKPALHVNFENADKFPQQAIMRSTKNLVAISQQIYNQNYTATLGASVHLWYYNFNSWKAVPPLKLPQPNGIVSDFAIVEPANPQNPYQVLYTRIVVGAVSNDPARSGLVQVFELQAKDTEDDDDIGVFVWKPVGGPITGEQMLGRQVQMSHDRSVMAVSSTSYEQDPNNPDGYIAQCLVRVYTLTGFHQGSLARGVEWRQLGQDLTGAPSIDNDDEYLSCETIQLSSDGSALVVGGRMLDADCPHTPSKAVGHVRVWSYDPTTSLWVRQGSDLDKLVAMPKTNFYNFGRELAFSNDAKRIVVLQEKGGKLQGRTLGSTELLVFDYQVTEKEWKFTGYAGQLSTPGVLGHISMSQDGTMLAMGLKMPVGLNGMVLTYKCKSSTSDSSKHDDMDPGLWPSDMVAEN